MKSLYGTKITVAGGEDYGNEVCLTLGEAPWDKAALLDPRRARKLARKLLKVADELEKAS